MHAFVFRVKLLFLQCTFEIYLACDHPSHLKINSRNHVLKRRKIWKELKVGSLKRRQGFRCVMWRLLTTGGRWYKAFACFGTREAYLLIYAFPLPYKWLPVSGLSSQSSHTIPTFARIVFGKHGVKILAQLGRRGRERVHMRRERRYLWVQMRLF